MVPARCLFLPALLVIIMMLDCGDSCPAKLAPAFKNIGKSIGNKFKLLKKAPVSDAAQIGKSSSLRRGAISTLADADAVKAAGKAAKAAQRSKEFKRNMAIGVGTAVGGLAVGSGVSAHLAIKKKQQAALED